MSIASNSRQGGPKVGGLSGSAPRKFAPRGSYHRTTGEESKTMSKVVGSKIGGGEGDNDNNEAESPNSLGHEAMKKHILFKKLFESMDALSLKEVNETEWACPACKGVVHSTNIYKGFKSLIDHAKNTKQENSILHRKLMKVLEEEFKRRSAAGFAVQQVYGKWLSLQEGHIDYEVVWPPMVIVENTNFNFKLQENQQSAGMGNKELLECFKAYKPIKAKQSYGPKGHRGISLLIFEDSAVGYLEADRLQMDFLKEARGRADWDRRGTVTQPAGGKRTLYGYMAKKEDMENFNKHLGNGKAKYDMSSYKSMVIEPVKKMKEDSQKLVWLQAKIVEDKEVTKSLEETVDTMASRLEIQKSEVKIIIKKVSEQYEKWKNGLDYLERVYKQQIDELMAEVEKRDQEIEKMELAAAKEGAVSTIKTF